MLDSKVKAAILFDLGIRIKEIRMAKSMEQPELASLCEMEIDTLAKIESGKVNVSFLTLYKLSKCLKVKVGEMIV